MWLFLGVRFMPQHTHCCRFRVVLVDVFASTSTHNSCSFFLFCFSIIIILNAMFFSFHISTQQQRPTHRTLFSKTRWNLFFFLETFDFSSFLVVFWIFRQLNMHRWVCQLLSTRSKVPQAHKRGRSLTSPQKQSQILFHDFSSLSAILPAIETNPN